jgi:hypothetical protein
MVEADWGLARWFTSRRSGAQGDCVECAMVDSVVGVRDSKDRDGPVLVFDRASWTAFVESVKRGELRRVVTGSR